MKAIAEKPGNCFQLSTNDMQLWAPGPVDKGVCGLQRGRPVSAQCRFPGLQFPSHMPSLSERYGCDFRILGMNPHVPTAGRTCKIFALKGPSTKAFLLVPSAHWGNN